MSTLKMYFSFIVIYLKSKLEYKIAFLCEIIANFILVIVYYVGIWIIFNNYESVFGWKYKEILLLFNINWLCYSISGFFLWEPMTNLGTKIQSGEFDAYLIRPIRPLLHLVVKQFQYTFLPRFLLSLYFLIKTIRDMDQDINIPVIIYTVINGVIIYSCVFILIGAVSFWLVQNKEVGDILTNSDYGMRNFVDYPLDIYNKPIKFLLTFIVPYAFVNYIPVSYLLDKDTDLHILKIASVTVIFVLITMLVWSRGLRKYNSTGT